MSTSSGIGSTSGGLTAPTTTTDSEDDLSTVPGTPAILSTSSPTATSTAVPLGTAPTVNAATDTGEDTATSTPVPGSASGTTTSTLTDEEKAAIMAQLSGLFTDGVDETAPVTPLAGVSTSTSTSGDVTGTTLTLDPVAPPATEFGPEQIKGTQVVCDMLNQALGEPFFTPEGLVKSLNQMSTDDLLAAFLKLNVNDPNNDPQTQEAMCEIAKKLKAVSVANEKVKLIEQEAQMEQARADAKKSDGYSKTFSIIMTVVIVIVAIVLSVVTFGTAAPALICLAAGAIAGYSKTGTMEGAMMGVQMAGSLFIAYCTFGTSSYISALLAAGSAAGTAYSAKLRAEAAEAQLEADELGLKAKKHGNDADRINEDIKDRQELIRLILEAKGKLIESVLNMLNAAAAAKNQVLSSAAAR